MIPEHKLKELQRIGAIKKYNITSTGMGIDTGDTMIFYYSEYKSNQSSDDLLTAHLERWVIEKAKERWGKEYQSFFARHEQVESGCFIWTGVLETNSLYEVEQRQVWGEYDTKLEVIVDACIAVGGGNA